MNTSLGARRVLRLLSAAARLTRRAAPVGLLLYSVLSLLGGVVPIATAWCTKVLLDGLAAGEVWLTLLPWAVALAVTGLMVGLLPVGTEYLKQRLDRAVAVVTMDRLYRAMGKLAGIARMEDPRFRDKLRLAQQTGRSGPGQLVDDGIGSVQAAVTLGGFLGTLIVINAGMAVIVLLAAIPALLANLRLSRARARVLWSIAPAERREVFYADLLASLDAAKELRLLGLGDLFRRRMLVELTAAHAVVEGQDRRDARVHGLLAGLTAAVAAGGLVWAVWLAAHGRLSLGDIAIFVASVGGVQSALQTLVARLASAHQSTLLFDHYDEIESQGPDLPVPAAPRRIGALRSGIELRDVWFRYAEDQPWVLRGVNLTIPHGRSLALVGLNGAGKSTVVKLLCRFYDPGRGAILWDGVDLRDLDVEDLRTRIGAVFQDYMCYDLSAAENIGLGDVSVMDDRERVVAAARRAGADAVVTGLPRGYDTFLSRMFFDEADRDDPETGVLLSGGQWQRLALARAFLRDRRDLMILDEPSSGLDAEAEHEVHSSLRRHREGATSVLISHRLGAVRDASVIAVLAEGRVAELGSHDELIASGGAYARLFRLQASGYDEVVSQ
ncbi:ABC transporter ATP-binding protein [Amycolatopsis azurea]|uniref:ABC transporter ATP-binding protein n=1 Tax=Amycolatopsis azurea DSM 43854 TaxID=1238180 RepID=M2NS41_9PSEU|nr:ABC transporter ATP-binding protein [Amycolatopsis azurea]EMD25154.1 ABC transporter ATP-binding protein [Amycolatopsis azurea DSM 43854]OOC01690.1 multidrug ABC transporter permease [Amycolatopsis azurea DSM 43854]